MSADTDFQSHMQRQDSGGLKGWGEGRAFSARVFVDLPFLERGTAENSSRCPLGSLLLTRAKAEVWLSLMLLIPVFYTDSTELDC